MEGKLPDKLYHIKLFKIYFTICLIVIASVLLLQTLVTGQVRRPLHYLVVLCVSRLALCRCFSLLYLSVLSGMIVDCFYQSHQITNLRRSDAILINQLVSLTPNLNIRIDLSKKSWTDEMKRLIFSYFQHQKFLKKNFSYLFLFSEPSPVYIFVSLL